jgi:hypothetical protein
MTLTKTSGNRVLEIDGRPALEVWREATGHSAGELLVQDYLASWAIAVEQDYELSGRLGSERRTAHMIRAAVGIDEDSGALIFQAGIAEGTRISFHHRVVDAVLSGTDQMGHDLAQRLQGKTPWAFLGFECGARTVPFLGTEKTVQENAALRAKLGAGVPWLGMMAWGELAPCAHGTRAAFHNYTYPLVALVEREP